MTEFFSETFFGSCDERLGLVVQKIEQLADPPIIKLGVQIIEKKQRIFASRGLIYGDISELKDEKGTSLLSCRTKFSEIVAVEKHLKIISMWADQSVTRDGFRLDSKLEAFRDQCLVIGKITFIFKRRYISYRDHLVAEQPVFERLVQTLNDPHPASMDPRRKRNELLVPRLEHFGHFFER